MKSKFGGKKQASGDIPLQITSMADIFMILLVFLLKNYAVSVSNLAPTSGLALPEVTKARGTIKETLKVEISQDLITVDQKAAVRLANFEFAENESAEGGHSPSVFRIVQQQRSLKPEPNMDSSMIIMADQRTPYSTVKRVVASVAKAGFVDLQLIVVETE